jgi:hypothetical protein
MMDGKGSQKGKPNPERMEALRNLPKEIVEQLSKEEVNAFLLDNEWPDSLHDKLKAFLE